jgi:hypothetical protein
MVNSTMSSPSNSLIPGVLTVLLPIVSGAAASPWSTWMASMGATHCDESKAGALGLATAIVIYLGPAIVVAYAAIAARKSRLAIVGLSVAAAVLTFVAVSIGAGFWTFEHNCFGS